MRRWDHPEKEIPASTPDSLGGVVHLYLSHPGPLHGLQALELLLELLVALSRHVSPIRQRASAN